MGAVDCRSLNSYLVIGCLITNEHLMESSDLRRVSLTQHPAPSCSPSHIVVCPLPFVSSSGKRGDLVFLCPQPSVFSWVLWRASCSWADLQIYLSSDLILPKYSTFSFGPAEKVINSVFQVSFAHLFPGCLSEKGKGKCWKHTANSWRGKLQAWWERLAVLMFLI